MPYLLDTNILLRTVRPSDPSHTLVRTALRTLAQRGEARHYAPQNLVEFWNMCTRPTTARGGFGLSLAQADQACRLVERLFTLLPDSPAVHTEWRRLVVTHGVSGVQVHDARLVACMLVHGIPNLLTLNTTDFSRYAAEGVTAVDPSAL